MTLEQPSIDFSMIQEPLEINLGEGKIAILPFTDSGGSGGLIFRDTGVKHKLGSRIRDLKLNPDELKPGEVCIRCSNRESAEVLLAQVKIMLDMFPS